VAEWVTGLAGDDAGFRRRQFDVGVGYAPAHHGELLQGMFTDEAGRWRRALVTLPQPGRGSRAVFRPSGNHWGIVGTPELVKVRRAAILVLREFAAHPAPVKGGQIEISRDFPLGIGMGSSTSDVTATIRAVADYHGVVLSREEVGRLAVLAEVASDSIMIDDRVVLFAHRDGQVVETFGHRLPPMVVVGCDTGPGSGVDTLSLQQADYGGPELGAFQVLRGAMRRAVATEDTGLLGRVATASARINQRFLPKPALEPLLELSLRLGGCGVQVAHSGTVAGLIFDPRLPGIQATVQRCAAGLSELGLPLTSVIGGPPGTPAPGGGQAGLPAQAAPAAAEAMVTAR
jgi:uncharacterized protein involved in propanediol utilization